MNSAHELNSHSHFSTFLAGSALPDLWPKKGNLIFLGGWCTRYSQRHLLYGRSHSTLPYHWDDRDKLHGDIESLSDVYNNLMPLLAKKLNDLHGEAFSERYWRIVCGWWLRYFVQVLFDRWTVLRQANARYPDAPLLAHLEFDSASISSDMTEFTLRVSSDEWNQSFFQQLAGNINGMEMSYTRSPLSPSPLHGPTIAKTRNWVGLARSIFSRIRMSGKTQMAWDGGFLSRKQKLQIARLSWRPFYAPTIAPTIDNAEDDNRRRWMIAQDAPDEISRLAGSLIAKHLPKAYLENFVDIGLLLDAQGWPKQPRVLVTANGFAENEVWNRWVASNVERFGAKYIITQHGGHYGLARSSSIFDHEVNVSDLYLSWGWQLADEPKVRPSVALRLMHTPRYRQGNRESCVLVGAGFPRYSYWLGSHPIAPQFEQVLNDQLAFVAELDESVRQTLIVRPYPHDYGWDERERLSDAFPDLEIDNARNPIAKLLRRARLCVITQNATALLECLARGYPTVAYWRQDLWELSAEAFPYVNALREVGIYFDDPTACAHHVNDVFSDTDAWWTREETQSVVSQFIDRYAKLKRNTSARFVRDVVAADK